MKKNKAIPDIPCLKYRGKPGKKDIKIFVSHRIDKDSEVIDNPLYIPVRCGAVHDNRNNLTTIGDDTGDNISEKRMTFCELTVHYWAWKNIEADYYGLCHYRRFHSFSEVQYENTDAHNHIVEQIIDDDFVKKYNLTEEYMRKIIEKNDIISLIPTRLDCLHDTPAITVYESIKNNPLTFPVEIVDDFLVVLKEKYPQLATEADDYCKNYVWRGFNCYILKKELFFNYSEILFDVLFEVEKRHDFKNFNQEQLRILGYIGEMMFGIYFNHVTKHKDICYKELQLIRIEHPQKRLDLLEAFEKHNVPVVMASSNEYVPFLSVLVQSIIEHISPNHNYDLIIINNDIKDYNKKLLKEFLSGITNVSLRFVDASTYLSGRKLYTRDHVTTMTYLRLAILDILSNYEKAIYLDCDVVLNEDVAKLIEMDLTGYYIAAAIDTVMAGWCNIKGNEQKKYNHETLGLKRSFEYFNAGIIVVNLEELRKNYTSKDLFDIAASKKWKWFDQDVLNIVCEGKVFFLENEWNVMVHRYDFEYQLTEYFAPEQIYRGYKKALQEPKAIHYAGRVLPCFVPQVDLADFFWHYARSSPYYELIISAMITNQIWDRHNLTFDPRSKFRKFADRLFPSGTKRRKFIKWLIPRNSLRWRILKKIQKYM